jgi:superfamily II DNA or RNA helicase
MDKYAYQDILVRNIANDIQAGTKEILLAAPPSAGKSYCILKLINSVINTARSRNEKIYIFCEAQNVLKEQFLKLFSSNKCDFTFGDENSNAEVIISIPQSIHNKGYLAKSFLNIIDEAHVYSWGKMHKRIKDILNPESNLYVTGSPSKFTLERTLGIRNISRHFISPEMLIKNGVFGKVDLNVSKVNTKISPVYNIDKVLRDIKSEGYDTSKTLIFCPTIKYAKLVAWKIQELGHTCYLSTNKNDPDSNNITAFEIDDTEFLITVDRCNAGWSFPKLTCLIDLISSTRNLDSNNQRFCRILREHPLDITKCYYRIGDNIDYNNQIIILHKLNALLNDRTFKKFNGSNLEIDYFALCA